ncbi:MAG: hypothetical protein QGH30_05945 [Candidatus Krumholzibacteria bacterium]|jgi:hypothetical protein|nr:hypothetical protein [Candidatus Krumholzibacteria bacterium]
MRLSTTIFAMLVLCLAFGSAGAVTYTSSLAGVISGSYDADPNGIFPDRVTYADFISGQSSYMLNLDYPPVEDGPFDWFIDPFLVIDAMVMNQNPTRFIIDNFGLTIYQLAEITTQISWADMGYDYYEGYGIFVGNSPTADDAFPLNPDALVGAWAFDQDLDGSNDIETIVYGVGGTHLAYLDLLRSMTWLGETETAIGEELSVWISENFPGMPTDFLRSVDLSSLVDLDNTVLAFGGPGYGLDMTFSGSFNFYITAHRDETAADSSSWSLLKSIY